MPQSAASRLRRKEGRAGATEEGAVGEQRAANVHVSDEVSQDAFVALRRARDAALPVPRLIYPSLQVNIRAGRLPEKQADGARYLKIPLIGALTG